ncbi:MAG TPA: glycosyltransferase family 1 protein [Chloroflexota bacterium]|nr:glycosyltransferase family 1 protein [Chloroflexota bacterium]
MPRIGFDGRDLLRKRTGVVNYAVHLAAHHSSNRDARLIVYTDRHVDPQVTPPTGVPLRRLAAPPVAWKHVALPLALLLDRVDLFHSPTGTLPLLAPCRQVVTIHDLFAAIEPRWFPSQRMARQLALSQKHAVHTSRAVVAVSQRTQRDLVERYGVPEAKVQVIPNGVDHARFRPIEVDPEQIARRFGVPHPFVLCVGSLMPWRNAPRLLRAMARFDGQVGLLFVGRDIWGTDPTARIAAEYGWQWARFAGYVPDADLPALYSAAGAFAYPSLYEGFGIPPLEAMACGIPVVASTAGALPEVLGDAALLVDPHDEDALAQALDAALHDAGMLRQRGLRHAARFHWAITAERTWRVYEGAVNQP